MTAGSKPDHSDHAGNRPEPSARRRVLVTGASGFVGSHVAEALAAAGFRVRVLVRRSSSLEFIAADAERAFGDVTDADSLPPALAGVDAVVHCAGLTRALSPEEFRKVNRDGTEKILTAGAALQCRLSAVVCISSLAAFGPSCQGKPVHEDDKPQPVSNYGRSKLEAHRLAESFMKELPVTILIPPAVYGPRDRDIFTYFRLAKTGFVPFIGRAERSLSLIHVKDLARAAVECLVRPAASGRSYFVDDGEIHTWKSLAAAISRTMKVKPISLTVPRFLALGIASAAQVASSLTRRPPLLGMEKMRELLQPAWTCSSGRIRRELGFETEYPLAKGLADTYRWYVEKRWL